MNNFLKKFFKKDTPDQNEFFDVPEEYEKIIEEAAKKKSRLLIPNITFEHAVLLTYHLIQNAKEEIKIFTSSSDLIYKDARIKKAMKKATMRGVKIKILLEKNEPLIRKKG